MSQFIFHSFVDGCGLYFQLETIKNGAAMPISVLCTYMCIFQQIRTEMLGHSVGMCSALGDYCQFLKAFMSFVSFAIYSHPTH